MYSLPSTDTVTLGVSFNGKTRFTLDFAADATKEEIEKATLASEQAHNYFYDLFAVKVFLG